MEHVAEEKRPHIVPIDRVLRLEEIVLLELNVFCEGGVFFREHETSLSEHFLAVLDEEGEVGEAAGEGHGDVAAAAADVDYGAGEGGPWEDVAEGSGFAVNCDGWFVSWCCAGGGKWEVEMKTYWLLHLPWLWRIELRGRGFSRSSQTWLHPDG